MENLELLCQLTFCTLKRPLEELSESSTQEMSDIKRVRSINGVKEESTSTSCLRNLNLKVLLAGNFKKRKSAQELCGGYVILAEIKTVCVCVRERERESK